MIVRRVVSASLTALLLVAVLPACASARPRGERVGGLFDDERENTDGGGGGGASGGAYAADVDAPAKEAEEVEVAASAPARSRGLFDFGGDKKAAAPRSEAPPPPPPPPGAPAAGPAEPEKPAPSEKTPEASGARLVIYKGNLTVMVPAVEPAVEKLSARAKELGGYVENQNGNSAANNNTVTLRVPAEKFYDLVNELGGYGQVMQKQISAQDVTKQVFDVELRLETAEKSRQRLLDLLKSATKMEEILQIENEVRRLTDEIEGMKGELRFLKDQVAMSTLSVTFYSNAPPPTAMHARTRSRFEWINQVGIEPVLSGF